MSKEPKDVKFTKDHEWIRVEAGNVGLCGISDHAQHLLTDVVFVELPVVGSTIEAGARIAVVESVKAVSDIYSPVTGRIIEVNSVLEESPELINSDPYGKGWIFKIGISNPEELTPLMDSTAYSAFIASE